MALNPSSGDELKVYFGYFMKGTNTAPVDQAASKAMMEGHLKNLTAIMLEKNGLAAVPLQDPTQQRRGIVAFQAKSKEEALKNFDNDPFVKNNIMSVQLMEWKADPKLFTIAKADPNSLTEYRLVILTPGKSMRPVNDAILKDHRDYVQSLTKTHQLRAHGEIQSPFKIREIGIFEGKDDKAIEEALKNDPLVKSYLLEVEILPLWMSKGIFGP
jgi:uncharacterized protein YciI